MGVASATLIAFVCFVVAQAGVAPVAVVRDNPWSVVLAPWTHVSPTHLVQNMFFLMLVAWPARRAVLPVFLIGGWVTNIVWLIADMPPATGSSGATYAVAGFAALALVFRKKMVGWVLFALAAVNMAAPTAQGALLAHGTGLISGLFIALAAHWWGANVQVQGSRKSSPAGLEETRRQRGDGRVLQEGAPVASGREVLGA